MFPLIGIVIVFGSIISGYIIEKGNIFVLIQPSEFIIIGGAALGSLIITCPPSLLSKVLKSFMGILGGNKLDKGAYLDLLSLLYTIFSKIKKEGLLAIEKDIESPEQSQIFQQYPSILKNHHAINFICDNLRVFVIGVKPTEMEDMMDVEMESHHQETEVVPAVITKIADSLPGFGIVAAVLGVVITMGKMDQSPEVIGESIAAALVGTFTGILLCYGLLSPIANHLEHKTRDESKYLEAIKASIIAFAKDSPPQMAVEAGRRVLFSEAKPSFIELEETIRGKKS